MNWIKNKILSFVQKTKDKFQKVRPSKQDQEKSLWINCPECSQMQLKDDLKKNFNVCKCNYHFDLDQSSMPQQSLACPQAFFDQVPDNQIATQVHAAMAELHWVSVSLEFVCCE